MRIPSRAAIVGALAAAKLALHLVTLSGYGWFRDELYYVACSRHLAWGYVDHPPLSIALLAAWRAAFGGALETMRIFPAIAGAAVVAWTGALAIELGGDKLAAFLAAFAALCAPAFIGFDHYYSMNPIDHLMWTASAWLALRATKAHATVAPRRWLVLGVVLGLGVLNKWSVLWLGFGILLALLATDARRLLRTPWPYAAGVAALALMAPHFAWEVREGWPTLEFIENAMSKKYVALTPGAFAAEEVKLMNPAAAPLAVLGLIGPFFVRGARRARLLSVIALVAQAVVIGSRSGKPEYLVASFPLLFASGALATEELTRVAGRSWIKITAGIQAAVMLVLAAVAAPFGLACLPVEQFVAYSNALGIKPSTSEKKELRELPQFYADMFGWNELVGAVGSAYQTLSPDERRGAAIWVIEGGYGAASAIDLFGPERGLPHAIAGHNNYWLWGYGDADGRAVVIVGGPQDRLSELFDSLEEVARVECARCMPYEDHKPIYVGRGMKKPFSEIWPLVKRYQ